MKNIVNIMKNINPKIQESQQILQRINTMKTIFRHIKVKLMETKDKQKNYLKSSQ